MARLLRVETCYGCPYRERDEDEPMARCTLTDDPDNAGYYLAIPRGQRIPDWCPLPEAEEVGDGEWEAEERLWGRE